MIHLLQRFLKVLMGQGNVASQRIDDASQMCMMDLMLGIALLHIALHNHRLTKGTIEVVVVDVVEHLVLPTEVEPAEVIVLQKDIRDT